jgi:hypothetical protein
MAELHRLARVRLARSQDRSGLRERRASEGDDPRDDPDGNARESEDGSGLRWRHDSERRDSRGERGRFASQHEGARAVARRRSSGTRDPAARAPHDAVSHVQWVKSLTLEGKRLACRVRIHARAGKRLARRVKSLVVAGFEAACGCVKRAAGTERGQHA